MSNKIVILFVLCFLHVVVESQKCEENRTSKYYYGTRLVCTDIQGLFPNITNFTKPVTNILCINCNIPKLDANTIHNFKGDTFNLTSSHVKTIESNAFSSYNTVSNFRTILLNNNEITFIAPGAFSNFSLLDEVNLTRNNLSKLDDETFQNTNVTVLDLSVNHISKINLGFSGLRVTKLNLSSNAIVEISENAFDNTAFGSGRRWSYASQVLDLSSNLIEEIKPNTFKAGAADNYLSMLYLKSNKITKIDNDTFSQLNYLVYLTLEDNVITDLNVNSFKGLSKLTTLILKANYIKEIPQSMLANLLLLENLDLSYNRLQTLNDYTFSGLANIATLNISHNNIKVLDELYLIPLGRLTTLDISNNALKTLNLPSIIEHHYKLKLLLINDNYWSCKHLVKMYKLLNQRIGGFHFPSHHFDVPNLHGIACSRTDADVFDYKSFEDFLSVISQDQMFEDLYDSRLTNNVDLNPQDVLAVIKTVNGIFYMILTILLMFMILFLQFMARHVCNYLNARKGLSGSRYSLKYAQNQDSVALI